MARARLSFWRALACSLLGLLLVACGTNPQEEDALIGNNNIRLKAVRDAAVSYGAQCGLAFRARYLHVLLKDQQDQMNAIFNFRAMLLKDNLLPPVLAASQDSLQVADENTMRSADQEVEVIHPARFVTNPPTWRDYLHLSSFAMPEMPNATLLPRDAEEWSIWRRGVRVGWAQGVEQCNSIFTEGLSRMKRDLMGMALYRIYADQGLVSRPRVGVAQLGVTGNHAHMRLNDTVMRITSHADLQPERIGHWKPIIVPASEHHQ